MAAYKVKGFRGVSSATNRLAQPVTNLSRAPIQIQLIEPHFSDEGASHCLYNGWQFLRERVISEWQFVREWVINEWQFVR